MATMLARVRTIPGREAAFEAIAAALWRSTHTDEVGVARYEYWRGAEPGQYYVLGSFDGNDGFIRHQLSEHHVAAGPALHDVIADLRLEWLDPVAEANGLAPTNASAAPPDAGELERSYRARHAVEVQEWWLPLRRGATH